MSICNNSGLNNLTVSITIHSYSFTIIYWTALSWSSRPFSRFYFSWINVLLQITIHSFSVGTINPLRCSNSSMLKACSNGTQKRNFDEFKRSCNWVFRFYEWCELDKNSFYRTWWFLVELDEFGLFYHERMKILQISPLPTWWWNLLEHFLCRFLEVF